METLLSRLKTDYPSLVFSEGASFCWSPQTKEVFYSRERRDEPSAVYSILHEVAHSLLEHAHYSADLELLQMEIAAWEKAKELGKKYGVTVDDEHVQDCLDSYRDWLYRRSICPSCGAKSIQHDNETHYHCFNCRSVWKVAPSRFCRPYRQRQGTKKSPAVFATDDSFSKV